MLTDAQLQRIMPTLAPARRQLYLPHLNDAMQRYGVDTLLRTAAFVAQLAHESGELRWMEELWGPTAAQRRYEPPSDLARRLGNTQPGDGARFKGRGPIQITGRYNYRKFGALLGTDLIADPALAATPEWAFATAGLYWESNGLNELADARQFVTITRRINGGTNGLADRQMYYERAQAVLGADAAPRGAPALAPLMRGFEAVRAARARKPAAKKAAAAPVGAKKATVKKAAPNKAPAAKVPAAHTKRSAVKAPAAHTKRSAVKAPAKRTVR
jgi:predicted chitinase